MRCRIIVISALMPLVLAGCDQLGIESATTLAARREAEGKAIGAGCRHAARSVEVCYGTNKRADKAAVFAGWREMNDYMRENKIDAMPAPPEPVKASTAEGEDGEDAAHAKDAKGAKTEKVAKAAPKGH
jgi:hypothetical protein